MVSFLFQSHPTVRLPALYVLDSISKNIGSPYVTLWGQRIAHIFLETYRLVDQPTKVRMEELLNTWRTAGQGGQPLYGGEAQWEIERTLYGSRGPPSAQPSHLQPPAGFGTHRSSPRPSTRSPMPHPSQAALPPGEQARRTKMAEQIDRLLALGTQDQYRNPKAFSPARMSALKQLKTVVQTATLSPQETDQIQNQLDTLAAEYQQSRTETSTPSSVPVGLPDQQTQNASLLPANIGSALENLSKMGVFGANGTSSSTHSPHPAQTATTLTPAQSNPSEDLIKSLMAAGLLPSSSGPIKPAAQDDAYTSAILNLDIKLTSADLQKELSEEAVQLVCYKDLPLQCRQCANRYPAGAAGQRSLDKHLDWHFKQGRRAKDSHARGLSRSWFERIYDWVRGGANDPSASANGGRDANAGKQGLSAQQEAELKAASEAWVAAPTDPSLANAPCPICKEKFQSEWSEDEEEWIWKNARKVEGAYYHGSCYYSAKALSANVSNRTTTPPGRRSTDRRSRTVTPPQRKTTSNPLERIKAEEGGSGSASGGDNSRKRKVSPSTEEGGEESGLEEQQQTKRVAA